MGGNQAVHGGIIPLLYDWLFGMIGDRRGHPADPDRVPARRLPQDHPDRRTTEAHGSITDIDGRKVFITATMTAADGTVLSEANGLMVRLLPHQP